MIPMNIGIFLIVLSIANTLTCYRQNIKLGNDPNFKIISHNDKGFRATNRKVLVFGIPIYAYAEVEDSKLLHAANITAQYLDNDEDGKVDNPTLLAALKDNVACLYMWKYESQININAQDLGADETQPKWHINGNIGAFDAALEEIWHVITYSGYAKAYPSIFGTHKERLLSKAMDIARGRYFRETPKSYPSQAWYTYDDETCGYECRLTEYFYWAMSSMLGAQKNRLHEISQEWRLNTEMLLKNKDKKIYALLSNPVYKFPKVLPDGAYKQ